MGVGRSWRRSGMRRPRRVVRQCGVVGGGRALLRGHCDLAQRLLVDVERVMAGGEMAVAVVDERRLYFLADIGRVAAARMEAAAARRVDRARDVSLEHDPLTLLRQIR